MSDVRIADKGCASQGHWLVILIGWVLECDPLDNTAALGDNTDRCLGVEAEDKLIRLSLKSRVDIETCFELLDDVSSCLSFKV